MAASIIRLRPTAESSRSIQIPTSPTCSPMHASRWHWLMSYIGPGRPVGGHQPQHPAGHCADHYAARVSAEPRAGSARLNIVDRTRETSDIPCRSHGMHGRRSSQLRFSHKRPAQTWHGDHAAPVQGADKAEGRVSTTGNG